MPSLLLSMAAVVQMIGWVGVPAAMMRPFWVTINAPGAPTVEPATTAACRGWPRMMVPGRIVRMAPFFTNSVCCRMIGLGFVALPQVVFVVMSA